MTEGPEKPIADRKRIAWYEWPFLPLVLFALPVVLAIFVILGILAAISIPYFSVYPDRHLHPYDLCDATPRQRELIAKWRHKYRSLGLWRRFKRALLTSLRRRRIKDHRIPAMVRRLRARQASNTDRSCPGISENPISD